MGSRMFSMVRDMLKHVYNMNEMSLSDMLEVAFEMYPVRVVCSDIIVPMMQEIGSLWEKGEMMVVMEHFASNIVVSKLKAMLHKQNVSTNRNGPTVFVGCAPDEQHEIGALIVAFFMSVNGWKVVYLGQNIPLSDLLNIIDTVPVHTIALSATNERTIGHLQQIGRHIESVAKKKPIEFLIGGRLLSMVPNVLDLVPGATTRSADDLYAYCPPTHLTHSDQMVRGALDGSYSLIKESYRKMRMAAERRKRTKFLLDQIRAEEVDEPIVTEEDVEACKEGADSLPPHASPSHVALGDKTKELEERLKAQKAQTDLIRERLQKYKQSKKPTGFSSSANRLVTGKYTGEGVKREEAGEEEKPVTYTPPSNLNRLVGMPRNAEPFTKLFHLNTPDSPLTLQANTYYPMYSNLPEHLAGEGETMHIE